MIVDQETHGQLCNNLDYDKRSKGFHGRCLRTALPALGLEVGDRLEPSGYLPDVAKLELVSSFPATLRFWRTSRETLARHRNPIFDRSLGISPNRCLTVDVLHAVNLGVMMVFCKFAFCKMVTSFVWGQHATAEETFANAVTACRHQLDTWYKARQQQRPDEHLTRINNFTKKVVGDPDAKKLKTKGAETWGFLLFLLDKLNANLVRLGPQGPKLLATAKVVGRAGAAVGCCPACVVAYPHPTIL